MKKWIKYFADHPNFNAIIHVAGGAGFALLLYQYFFPYLPALAWILVIVWAVGHIWSWMNK